ncbi:unnamed protein product [Periconia digitata]|uniref:Rhodopsin domain-containing protein n=1 Tax=Periconia digitata TaxID=1303443 RepID=A0A9W4UKF4_9PLEO|nr:unnamed protein product [Periconia digitata]
MPTLQLRTSIEGQDPIATSIPTDFVSLASICLFLTLMAASLRIFTKTVDIKRVQVDDYVIIISTVGFTVFIGIMFAAANAGLSLPTAELSLQQYKSAVRLSDALDITYAPTMFAAKLAILIQLARFRHARKQLVYWSVRFLIVLNVLCYTGVFIVQAINCYFNSNLDAKTAPGLSGTRNFTGITSGTTNVISNLFILVLAVFGVAAMQLSRTRQVFLGLMLLLGSFTCAASIVRLVYSVRVEGSPDFSVTVWALHKWSIGELTSIIYCACCPTFPRLLQYIQGRSSPSPPTHTKQIDDLENSRSETAMSDYEFEELLKQPPKVFNGIRYYNKPTPIPQPLARSNSAKTYRIPITRSNSTPTRNFSRTIYTDSPQQNTSRTSILRTTSPPPIQPQKSLRRTPIYHIDALASLPPPPPIPFTPPYPSTPVHSIPEYDIPISPGSPTQSHFPVSPSTTNNTSWPSPTQTEFSVPEVNDATQLRMMPVYFATIRKTVDVRVSSHTNPGSPITWAKGGTPRMW